MCSHRLQNCQLRRAGPAPEDGGGNASIALSTAASDSPSRWFSAMFCASARPSRSRNNDMTWFLARDLRLRRRELHRERRVTHRLVRNIASRLTLPFPAAAECRRGSVGASPAGPRDLPQLPGQAALSQTARYAPFRRSVNLSSGCTISAFLGCPLWQASLQRLGKTDTRSLRIAATSYTRSWPGEVQLCQILSTSLIETGFSGLSSQRARSGVGQHRCPVWTE